MCWYSQAIGKYNLPPLTPELKEFTDQIDIKEPHNAYRTLNEHLLHRTFLNGHSLSCDDFYLASKLKSCDPWSKVLSSKTGPFHLCRWFLHIFSLNPDSSFEVNKRGSAKMDTRLIDALKANDMPTFSFLLNIVDVNARKPGENGPRAIHIACKMNNIEALKLLLAKDCSIETTDEEGVTPIFYAAKYGNMDTLKYLISLGANIQHKEFQNRSLFFYACSSAHLEIVKFLVSVGCDPNEETILGRSALSKTAWNGSGELMKMLLSLPGIAVNSPDKRGRRPLHNAVWGSSGGRLGKKMGNNSEDSPICAQLLLDHGADIEAVDNSLNTPLCIASSTYAPNSMKVLLSYGASMQHENRKGLFPYFQAIGRGNLECAEILEGNGFDLNRKNQFGESHVQIAIKYNQLGSLSYLLGKGVDLQVAEFKYALQCASLETVMLVAERVGWFEGIGTFSLEHASQKVLFWVLEYAKELVEGDIELAILRGNDIAKFAISKCFSSLSTAILTKCINLGIEINNDFEKFAISGDCFLNSIVHRNEELSLLILQRNSGLHLYRDRHGKTPLHLSCFYGLSKLTNQLIRTADEPCEYITLLDNDGLSAMFLAEANKHTYLSELLRDMYSQATDSDLVSHIRSLEYTEITEPVLPHPMNPSKFPQSYLPPTNGTIELHETNWLWIDTIETLQTMKTELDIETIVGVDLEYFSFNTHVGCICLIQLSTGRKDYIVDPLRNRQEIGKYMRELMGNPDKVKVLHGCDSDLLWLQNDFDAHSVRVFDTARAYKVLSSEGSLPSLAMLLNRYLHLKIDKTFQIADWRIRPLPSAMINYARTDAHYLPALYRTFIEEMSEKQALSLVTQCTSMCLKSPTGKLQRIQVDGND